MKHYQMRFVFTCGWLITALIPTLKAQDATIAKFSMECAVNDDYDIWGEESNDFNYRNAKNREATIPVADTMISYAQQAIGRKLGIHFEKQEVGDVEQGPRGEIIGFPNDRVKKIAALGEYNTLVEIFVTTSPSPAKTSGIGPFKLRKYKIDMIVEVNIYNKDGKKTDNFKKRTRMDEVKETTAIFGIREINALNGNELFLLFATALDNALASRR